MKKHLRKLSASSRKHLSRLNSRRNKEIIPASMMPRITNDTIAEHREEVLAGARKFIYPLQHSKHRIVLVSAGIFIATILAFFAYCIVALYRFQTTSTFMYRVTQVVPFPVAKTGSQFVSYESYLFELRHYMHYYETQQKLSFKSDQGREQLANFKKRALERVTDDAYIKKLAKENNITVTSKEVDAQIEVVRSQNRLGNNNQVFEDVLEDFWGWSINDFKRSLRQQLLAQKVASALDTEAHAKATAAMNELNAGVAFADVAKKYSDDVSTKANGGDFGIAIDKTNRDLSAQTTATMFKLSPGQYSQPIDTGYSLEIIKVNSFEGDKAKGAHVQINFKDISEFLNPLKDEQKTRQFVKV